MQIIIGKLNPTLTQGLLSGLEGYFHTEEDSEQVPISLESHKKLFYTLLEYKKDLNLNIILYWHKVLLQDILERSKK